MKPDLHVFINTRVIVRLMIAVHDGLIPQNEKTPAALQIEMQSICEDWLNRVDPEDQNLDEAPRERLARHTARVLVTPALQELAKIYEAEELQKFIDCGVVTETIGDDGEMQYAWARE